LARHPENPVGHDQKPCIAATPQLRYNRRAMPRVDLENHSTECPQCKSGSGQPDRAAPHEQHQTVRLLLRCDQCKHRWSILVPSPAVTRN
jgi:hypothetical protein